MEELDRVNIAALGFKVHGVTLCNYQTGEVWYASPTSIPDVEIEIDLSILRRTKPQQYGKNRARHLRKREWMRR